MARSRNIKPGFFVNEDLLEVDPWTRLLFIGLWTLADKAGRLEDRPKKIKIGVFPVDNVDVTVMLSELNRLGFIKRYEVDGSKYIQIVNWDKHQNPHHTEKESVIPNEHGVLTVKKQLKTSDSPKQHGGNPADSLIPDSGFIDSPITENTLPKGSGGQAAKITDPQEIIFGYGVPYLVNSGTPDKQARSFLGKLRKMHGDDVLIDKLRACMREKPLQPLEWLAAALPPVLVGGKKLNKQEALEASNRAIGDEWAAEMMAKMNGGAYACE